MNNIRSSALIVFYSHSGQTRSAVEYLAQGLSEKGFTVCLSEIRPQEEIPFPWNKERFFGCFPETVFQKPLEIRLNPETDPAFGWSLVILAFPPWFLAPARPFVSFLKSGWLKALPKETPVVALITCRNMWVAAMNDLKRALGARLKGFAVFPDPHPNLISLVSTLRFLLKGQKKLFGSWGPEAGFSLEKNIRKIDTMADCLAEVVDSGRWDSLQEKFIRSGLVSVKPALMLMEKRGRRNFVGFARYIESAETPSGRRRRIRILSQLLPVAVFILSPLTIILTHLQKLLQGKKLKELCDNAASTAPLPHGIFADPI